METVLIAVAAAFVVFAGANDGGALLVTSLKIQSFRPAVAAVVITCAVMAAPVVFGTQVATTLASRLVDLRGSGDQLALVLAVSGAIAVVFVLARTGLPTSLTLALVGGLVGLGVGADRPIAWAWVALVLVMAAVAPFVGLAAAFGLARLWGRLRMRSPVSQQARRAHRLGLTMQAFAYGANDGQKMLAVFALAAPSALDEGRVVPRVWMLAAVGTLFALGVVLGLRRYGSRLNATVRTLHPVHAVTAQFSAAVAVTGSAAIGAPASMTQAITGALIGSGLTEGVARVRWRQAAGIVAAWVMTLPIAAAVVALPALLLLRT